MTLSSTSILVVEQDPQIGCHKCLFPRWSPRCILPLWKALQDHQMGLTQAPVKLLSLHWGLEPVRVGVCLLDRGSVSCSLLVFLCASPTVNQTFWQLIFPLQDPPGSPTWGLGPLLLGENFCNCDYPPICGSSQGGGWILTVLHLHLSYSSLCGSFCISLAVEDLFC